MHMLIPHNPSQNLHRADNRPEPADVQVIEVPWADEPTETPKALINGRTRIINAAVDPSVQ